MRTYHLPHLYACIKNYCTFNQTYDSNRYSILAIQDTYRSDYVAPGTLCSSTGGVIPVWLCGCIYGIALDMTVNTDAHLPYITRLPGRRRFIASISSKSSYRYPLIVLPPRSTHCRWDPCKLSLATSPYFIIAKILH